MKERTTNHPHGHSPQSQSSRVDSKYTEDGGHGCLRCRKLMRGWPVRRRDRAAALCFPFELQELVGEGVLVTSQRERRAPRRRWRRPQFRTRRPNSTTRRSDCPPQVYERLDEAGWEMAIGRPTGYDHQQRFRGSGQPISISSPKPPIP